MKEWDIPRELPHLIKIWMVLRLYFGTSFPLEILNLGAAKMTNHEKRKKIIPWIDPEERVTVHFLDEQDLTAEVTGSTEELVDLALETKLPHMWQRISVPLRLTEVSEDPEHYTRNPERPLKHSRLMLVINENRPAIIY